MENSIDATGDGPVDAAFNAVKMLWPHKARLQLYQVHAVTEGTDAQATVSVRMRGGGAHRHRPGRRYRHDRGQREGLCERAEPAETASRDGRRRHRHQAGQHVFALTPGSRWNDQEDGQGRLFPFDEAQIDAFQVRKVARSAGSEIRWLRSAETTAASGIQIAGRISPHPSGSAHSQSRPAPRRRGKCLGSLKMIDRIDAATGAPHPHRRTGADKVLMGAPEADRLAVIAAENQPFRIADGKGGDI